MDMEGSMRRHSNERSGDVGHLNLPDKGREPEEERTSNTVSHLSVFGWNEDVMWLKNVAVDYTSGKWNNVTSG